MLRQINKWLLVITCLSLSVGLFNQPVGLGTANKKPLVALKPIVKKIVQPVLPPIPTEPFLQVDWRKANRWQELKDFHYFLQVAGLRVMQFVVATEKTQLGAEVQLLELDEAKILKAVQQMMQQYPLEVEVIHHSKQIKLQNNYQLRFTSNNADSFDILLQQTPTALWEKRAALEVKNQAPVLVIVLDDLGYNKKRVAEFLALKKDLTFSIIPFLPFSAEIAEMVHQENRQILLHMPMEALNTNLKPYAEALFLVDSPQDIANKMHSALLNIPYALGFNNHMGSAFILNAQQTEQLVKVSKQRQLIFVDSKTVATSIPRDIARKYKLAYTARDVFLDNDRSRQQIKKQLELAVKLAKKHGEAVAIAHPYPQTLAVLKAELSKISQQVQITGIYNLPSLHQWKQQWGVL